MWFGLSGQNRSVLDVLYVVSSVHFAPVTLKRLFVAIIFHRERERELYGPKKRGPKPKTFLLKVNVPAWVVTAFYSKEPLIYFRPNEPDDVYCAYLKRELTGVYLLCVLHITRESFFGVDQ